MLVLCDVCNPACAHIPPHTAQVCTLAQPCYYTLSSLAVLVASYMGLFFLASTLIVPGGLFM